MNIVRSLLILLCCVTVMSFRTITRSPLKAIRVPLRMMSDQQEVRTYVGYSLYKSKSSVNVKPIPATLKVENGIRTVAKEGALMFEFAPGSNKEYDWSKKTMFALSATECAELVRTKDADTVSFMHSPGLLSKSFTKCSCFVKLISPTSAAVSPLHYSTQLGTPRSRRGCKLHRWRTGKVDNFSLLLSAFYPAS
jgi:hypothetical protein